MKTLRAFWSAFVLELRALFRTGAFFAALALCAAAVAFLPSFLRSDGTAAGMVALYVRVVFGAVFLISGFSAFGAACGAYAPERGSNRLSLDILRPFPPALAYIAKCCALAVFAASVAFCGGAGATARLVFDKDLNPSGELPDCRRLFTPDFEKSLSQEARDDYEKVLAAEPRNDFERQRLANYRDNPRFMVMWALEKKIENAVGIVSPGKTHKLRFRAPGGPCTVRIRCPLLLGLRSTFGGEFTLGGETAVVTNVPGSTLEVDFKSPAPDASGAIDFEFRNKASRAVALRQRRDIVLLAPGDSFIANFVRAALAWTGITALFCAFGLMLSSALSRPVALFSAAVVLATLLLAPLSSAQIPNPSHISAGDFIGICVSHVLADALAPVFSASPVGALSENIAVPWSDVALMLFLGQAAAPALMSFLAASALKSKPQE